MEQSEKTPAREKLISALEELTRERGFLHSLALMLRRDLFFKAEEAAHVDWSKRLTLQEFSFLAGIMVKHEMTMCVPSEAAAVSQIERTYNIFRRLHETFMAPFVGRLVATARKEAAAPQEEVRASIEDIFGSGDLMSEAIFYGPSGAHDFQYLEFAPRRYGYDDEWIRNNRGVSVQTMAEVAAFLKQLRQQKLRNCGEVECLEDFCKQSLWMFSFCRADLVSFDSGELERFLEHFTVVPGAVNQGFASPGAYNVLDSRPIIRLEPDSYFLPVSLNLAQSIYESPFYWMLGDEAYKESSFQHRGRAAEDIVYDILVPVFGRENVFRNVTVSRNKHEIASEIDVLAVAGNKALVLQAKSKKLTELARTGDTEKLKADFEDAIQKAYDQGAVCRRAILDGHNRLCAESGQELTLDESIDDAYIVCVTSDDYPAITHQVDVYLKKKPQDPYPVALNVFDLEILTFYLNDPLEFLYYIRQRTSLSGYFKANSEMALLGYYVNVGLRRTPKNDFVMIDDAFAQLVDANFPVVRGHHPKTKAAEALHRKWKNQKFEKLVEQVKTTAERGLTDAVFLLCDLAGPEADRLVNTMDKVKSKSLSDGKLHDFSMVLEGGKAGVTFVCPPYGARGIQEGLIAFASARKYKAKADTWLAMASLPGSSNMIDAVAFNKSPWSEDRELDLLAGTLLTRTTPRAANGKKIGRNAPCYCGSGKKYKKCCGIR